MQIARKGLARLTMRKRSQIGRLIAKKHTLVGIENTLYIITVILFLNQCLDTKEVALVRKKGGHRDWFPLGSSDQKVMKKSI